MVAAAFEIHYDTTFIFLFCFILTITSKLRLSFTDASLVPYVKKREFNIELKERMRESNESKKVYIFFKSFFE